MLRDRSAYEPTNGSSRDPRRSVRPGRTSCGCCRASPRIQCEVRPGGCVSTVRQQVRCPECRMRAPHGAPPPEVRDEAAALGRRRPGPRGSRGVRRRDAAPAPGRGELGLPRAGAVDRPPSGRCHAGAAGGGRRPAGPPEEVVAGSTDRHVRSATCRLPCRGLRLLGAGPWHAAASAGAGPGDGQGRLGRVHEARPGVRAGWSRTSTTCPAGYVIYAPPAFVPRAAAFPTAPVGSDAVLLTAAAWSAPSTRGRARAGAGAGGREGPDPSRGAGDRGVRRGRRRGLRACCSARLTWRRSGSCACVSTRGTRGCGWTCARRDLARSGRRGAGADQRCGAAVPGRGQPDLHVARRRSAADEVGEPDAAGGCVVVRRQVQPLHGDHDGLGDGVAETGVGQPRRRRPGW